jgi:hypothetical protein
MAPNSIESKQAIVPACSVRQLDYVWRSHHSVSREPEHQVSGEIISP